MTDYSTSGVPKALPERTEVGESVSGSERFEKRDLPGLGRAEGSRNLAGLILVQCVGDGLNFVSARWRPHMLPCPRFRDLAVCGHLLQK